MTAPEWRDISERLADALEAGGAGALDTHLGRFAAAHHSAGDWLEPAADPLVGRVLAGRFHLGRVLGRGGAGTVYLASDADAAGGQVVVKVLHPFWTGGADVR